jgi:hypothetical protein
MARMGFVASVGFVALGVLLMAVGLLVQQLVPKIGWLVYQAAGGSYNEGPYIISLGVYYAIAIVCVVAGLVLAARFYKQGKTQG